MRLNELFKRMKEKKATAAEQELFTQWFEQANLLKKEQPFTGMEEEEEIKLGMKKAIQQRLAERKRTVMIRIAKVAAILIIVLGAGLVVRQVARPEMADKTTVESAIIPGEKRVIVHLNNGISIPVNSETNPKDLEPYGMQLVKECLHINPGTATGLKYTIETPVGGEYRVQLSDGSLVCLNAKSRLSFPAGFEAASRTVEAEGEVYFEVTHNPQRPFRVVTPGQQVDVLGTKFLINTQREHNNITTTLFEGKIRLKQGHKEIVMKPGEVSHVDIGNQRVDIVQAQNTTQPIAWTAGYFDFTGADFESVARQIENWYDVKFVDLPESPDAFYGKISRSSGIQEILKMLEMVSRVQFKIEGRNIYVIK